MVCLLRAGCVRTSCLSCSAPLRLDSSSVIVVVGGHVWRRGAPRLGIESPCLMAWASLGLRCRASGTTRSPSPRPRRLYDNLWAFGQDLDGVLVAVDGDRAPCGFDPRQVHQPCDLQERTSVVAVREPGGGWSRRGPAVCGLRRRLGLQPACRSACGRSRCTRSSEQLAAVARRDSSGCGAGWGVVIGSGVPRLAAPQSPLQCSRCWLPAVVRRSHDH
jgi:hypothetical protein